MAKVINRNIKYTDRDFVNIRERLINFSKTYFPNTYTDFDPSSPGVMFIEQAAYVSDVLSFYLDNQVQETYLQYARQNNNLFELAYMFGYKPKLTGMANAELDFFQQVPAKTINGTQTPDYDYALKIPGNTTVSSRNGYNFTIEDELDFSVSSSSDPTTISVAQITGNEPSYYLLKKKRNAMSGTIKSATFSFGEYQEFPTVVIQDSNFGGIIDAVDSNGNQYYEVDYLAQELIYSDVKNTNTNDPNNYQNEGNTPYILKTFQTPYRFVTRILNNRAIQLQFGSGNPNDVTEEVIPNSDNVGLGLTFTKNKLTTAYSPTNFIFTNTYGIAPSNTQITVRYYSGGGVGSNVEANTLTRLDTSNIKFLNTNLNSSTSNYVFNSLAVNNPKAASGGRAGDTLDELRQNIMSNSNTQLRAVTADDYLIRALSMPGKYGIISKAYAQKPLSQQENTTLDIYVLSSDGAGNLAAPSISLKRNLREYLNQYRMIGDTIAIKDAFVINIGIEFDIVTIPEVNNNDVLRSCILNLQRILATERQSINEPISIRELEVGLDSVKGVQTVNSIKVINKYGGAYSQYEYDIDGATQSRIIYPSIDPMIFELKFPNEDIKGRVVTI